MELTATCAKSMARMLSWLEYKQFATVIPAGSKPQNIIHRSADDESRDSNVIYDTRFSSDQLQKQVTSAFDIVRNHEPDLSKWQRDKVLSFLANLDAEYGAEGSKRFSELSYIGCRLVAKHHEQPYQALAAFWADFRTFIDVERMTKIGHAFEVEHFTEHYSVINDAEGPRIKHVNGAGMSLSHMNQMERAKRSDL